MASHPLFCPVYLPGQEPLPPGTTDADRAQIKQMAEWSKIMTGAMESCAFKCAFSGVAGFGLGGFFSLLSASFAVDDPLRRSNLQAAAMARNPNMPAPPEMTTMQTTKEFFRETGRSMYRSGKGFGKVGALYAGIECCIEAFRAKHDLTNPVAAGFAAGAILARNSGAQGIVGGGVAFAAFSGAIDWYLNKEPAPEP